MKPYDCNSCGNSVISRRLPVDWKQEEGKYLCTICKKKPKTKISSERNGKLRKLFE